MENELKKLKLWKDTIEFISKKYNQNIFNKFKKESSKCAVIVEPRIHPDLDGVLKNFASKLDNSWSLNIFHGSNNKEHILNIIGEKTNIKLFDLGVENLTKYEYSDLLLKIDFWQNINAKKILIFQVDCLLRDNIDNFLDYDYIGAPWKNDNICLQVTNSNVGNGGLSIRSKDAMIKTLQIIKPTFKSNMNMTEDIFYSLWMKKLNYNIPSPYIASLFSSEHIFNKKSKGLHKIYSYLSYEQMVELLNLKFF